VAEQTNYPLGYSDEESHRLRQQAGLLEEPTREVLKRAGLHGGMQVLDLGSGVGDVALLAGTLVGESGGVLGVDRAPSSIATARQRAQAAGAGHVQFEIGDVGAFVPPREFDAIIGRLVLLYLPDPANVLRRLLQHLRPGGIVAFLEFDITQVSQVPPSELFMQVRGWVLDAFKIGGAEVDMGSKLHRTFLHAGLPAPHMTAFTHISSGRYDEGFEYLVAVLRSLLPLVERGAIARPEEIQIDTLAARLQADSDAHERLAFLPRVVGAWTVRPG
jgi:ubiquinone/menaquinone biosynthesis C-methylase UbiE